MKKIIKTVANKISNFLSKITNPIRKSKIWKWLRKRILKSPFRGYFVNAWKELKKVEWPNRKTSFNLTFIVIGFTVLFALFTTLLDFGFEKIAKQIFLK